MRLADYRFYCDFKRQTDRWTDRQINKHQRFYCIGRIDLRFKDPQVAYHMASTEKLWASWISQARKIPIMLSTIIVAQSLIKSWLSLTIMGKKGHFLFHHLTHYSLLFCNERCVWCVMVCILYITLLRDVTRTDTAVIILSVFLFLQALTGTAYKYKCSCLPSNGKGRTQTISGQQHIKDGKRWSWIHPF